MTTNYNNTAIMAVLHCQKAAREADEWKRDYLKRVLGDRKGNQ